MYIYNMTGPEDQKTSEILCADMPYSRAGPVTNVE